MTSAGAARGGRRHPSGQATAEFALVATGFLLLIFAIMQMAQVVFAYNAICSAAADAARYAIVHGPTGPNPATSSQIRQIAIDAAPSLNLSPSDVAVSWPANPSLPSRQDAQISISYDYPLQIPLMSPITLTLTSGSRMLVSQ